MASAKKIREVLDLLTTADSFQIESLNEAASFNTKALRTIVHTKNVIGLGISEKLSKDKSTGKLALTFYVKKKVPIENLIIDEAIPATVSKAISGISSVPTDVVEIGDILPQANFTNNPIQPGNSVGHFKVTCGTLGAIVTDGTDYFILSNSHILADSGNAGLGDEILYPGKTDGGKTIVDKLGTLERFIPFIKGEGYLNQTDCAIAKISQNRLNQINVTLKNKDLPKGRIRPKRGMIVYKVGRTSNYTEGTIRDVDFRLQVPYGSGLGDIGFINQVLCTNFTEGGDSGALVLDKKTNKAVGLHFCGGNAGSVFNQIDLVLEALGVKLVTKKLT